MSTEERSNAANAPLQALADNLARRYTREALGALCREIRGPLHVIIGSVQLLEFSPPRHRAALIADIRQGTDELLGLMGRAIQVANGGASADRGGAPILDAFRSRGRQAGRRFMSVWRHLRSRRRAVSVGAAT